MSTKQKAKLDPEEQTTLEAFEELVDNAKIKSIPNVKKEIKRIKAMAKYSTNKNKRVSLRMTEWDFNKIQEKALQEGLPYQTLLASIIHKFVAGRLVDKVSFSESRK